MAKELKVARHQGMTGGVVDVVAFAVTAKMFPANIALATTIVETSLNMAIATSPYIGALLYEVGGGS